MTEERAAVSAGERPWPAALLLDELALRSRRTLIMELDRRGIWPDRPRHRRHLNAQRALGERLRDGELRSLLGDAGFALLRSRKLFGISNRRVSERLPLELALGYELGVGLHALTHDDDAAAALAGTRCAVFNLGVTLFDVVCDHLPDLVAGLCAVVDEARLRDLVEDPAAAERLAHDAAGLDQPELRLVAGVIAAFFTRAMAEDERPVASPPELHELITRAYRAQMQSVSGADMSRREARLAAREKSTLPFAVIGAIAAGCDAAAASSVPARPLVEDIGVAFWLADDLCDAVVDFRRGALNALLVDAYGGFGPGAYPQAGPSGLVVILDGGALDSAAREVGSRLERAVGDATAVGGEAGPRLAEVLICAVRDWVE